MINFKAFVNILEARGIKVERVGEEPYIGDAFGDNGECFYVRPENGMTFSCGREAAKFTPINIDGYTYIFEDFLPQYSEDGIVSPELIMFNIKIKE